MLVYGIFEYDANLYTCTALYRVCAITWTTT